MPSLTSDHSVTAQQKISFRELADTIESVLEEIQKNKAARLHDEITSYRSERPLLVAP